MYLYFKFIKYKRIYQLNGLSLAGGSVAGGAKLVVTGSGFGTDEDMLSVYIGPYECKVG